MRQRSRNFYAKNQGNIAQLNIPKTCWAVNSITGIEIEITVNEHELLSNKQKNH